MSGTQLRVESALAPLRSAYFEGNAEPPLTTKTASFAGCIDYIWCGALGPFLLSLSVADASSHDNNDSIGGLRWNATAPSELCFIPKRNFPDKVSRAAQGATGAECVDCPLSATHFLGVHHQTIQNDDQIV